MFDSRCWTMDGGLASTLEAQGCKCDGHPLWSAKILFEKPQEIYKARNDSGKENILIAGSVGPYGACLADGSEYTGKYIDTLTEDDLMKWHEPRIQGLCDAGVDLVAIETIPSLIEAKAVLNVLKKFSPMKGWISFSCRDEKCTNYGDLFRMCVAHCAEVYSDILVGIGINCSPPSIITPLLSEASKAVPELSIPYVVYPNSGEVWDTNKGWLPTVNQVSSFSSEVPSWAEMGARVIGGCCRVEPDEIKKISNILKKL